MITLQIDNPNIEKIFLEDFNSNKEEFLKFIENSYNKMKRIYKVISDFLHRP